MNTVVFYSEKGVPKEYLVIIEALNAAYRGVNLLFTDTLKNINSKNIVLILFSGIKQSSLKYLDESTHIIVDSVNRRSIKALARCKHRVYTCGFSSKDYITFSSKLERDTIISLQRNIKPLNNIVCEPFELQCKLKAEYNDFTILSCVLALILLNLVDIEGKTPITI